MSEEMEQSANMDAMLDAIHQKNLAQARAHFDGIMADKIGDALEHEKINIAAQFYGTTEPEYDESEVPQEDDTEDSWDENEFGEYEASAEESEESEEDWSDFEAELEDSFEENDEQEELEV